MYFEISISMQHDLLLSAREREGERERESTRWPSALDRVDRRTTARRFRVTPVDYFPRHRRPLLSPSLSYLSGISAPVSRDRAKRAKSINEREVPTGKRHGGGRA